MDIQRYLDVITTYQINTLLISFLGVALIVGLLFYYYTNDLKPSIITFLSVALVPVLTLILLFILYRYFDILHSEKHMLIMWASLFINIINLSVLISKYAREVIKKDFDIDYVTRYHFCSTLNLFIIILLTVGTVSIFMEVEMLLILLGILTVSSIVIWFNHLIARLLLQDK